MNTEEHKKKYYILGACGGFFMASGDWLLSCIPLEETDSGIFNRSYCLSGSYDT